MKTLVAVACLATFASSYAQDKPAPPPIWQQGRPPEMADSKLAPHPGKMTETPPGEIPLDTIKLPEGFKAELWAHGLPGGRAMARGQKGKIYVGTRAIGRVYEVSDEGGKRRVRIVAEKMNQPAGVAFANGSLYVASIDRVLRYDGIEDKPDVQPVDLTSKFNLRRSSTTTGSTSRSGRTRSCTCRSGRRATSASHRRNTRRSGDTTPMGQAWR